MSKDDKSSPSPTHGLSFDPAHLLGVHTMAAAAAAGMQFPHLAHLSNPYSLLTSPPAFPGLFGGLGSIPHPLHAAALSHSLATASYYGLPKHPNEMSSPSSPSSSPSCKGGRSSRSPASSTPSSSHRHSVSRTPSSPSTSSAHTATSMSPYLPSWTLNGSAYPFSHPLPTSESKQSSTSSASFSRRSRKSSSSKSESRSSNKDSGKVPQAHQHTTMSPLLSIPAAHLPASLLDPKSGRSMSSDSFPFDPHSLITPYHMSPELAYLSQTLFLHRPDLGLPSPFLTVPAAAAAASSTSSSSSAVTAASTTTANVGLEPGQVVLSSSSSKPSTSSSSSALNTTDDHFKKERKKREKLDESARPDGHRSNSGVSSSSHSVRSKEINEGRKHAEEQLLMDLSQPSHCMDDVRKRQIAEQIRKRIGMQDGVAALLSKHGIKQSDWLDSNPVKGVKPDESEGRSEGYEVNPGSQAARQRSVSESWRESKKMEMPNNATLETDVQRQEQPLRLTKRHSLGDESMLSHLEESINSTAYSHGLSETDDSLLDNGLGSEHLDMRSTTGSDSDGSGPDNGKRAADGSNDEGSPNKKRCLRLDERELTIPLEHGWNRQTVINGMGRRGIVGEVLYFAPCGKKMKTIPDVMRYLERNPNADLGRENFSFNTKVNVGQFFEVQGGHGSTPVPLSDAEILEKIEMSQGRRARMQMLARKKREKAAREQALARQIMESKLKRRMELQEISRRVCEMRFEKRLEQQSQKEMEKKERENKVMERRKEKEQHKMLKQQEKIRIQEQLRKEREMRAHQIIEARNRRQKELEVMRMADAVQRNKEREMKRQHLIIMKEQERERRRQHLLLVRALEQRKRQEEKQHQRQVELEVAMELKKPLEDMELKNAKPLPLYPRLKSRLPGRPIADCLMVIEFLNNFGAALNLDKPSIPSLESLERGLLNESEEDVEDFMSLVMHLLRFALDDVGVPNPKEAITKLNQKITEMEMTDSTMSEVLRIFVRARGEKEMSEWLSDKPMEALNSTKKAAILAFLCNELLTSKVISCEIDKHMDSINNLRRDKWLVEGQLRQLRLFQARKFNKIHKSTDRRLLNAALSNHLNGGDEDTMSSSKLESDDEEDKDEDDDKEEEEESGNDSDGSSSVATSASISSNTPFEPVDESLTREESDKKIEKLRKQHAAFRQKVFRASLRLRAINIGQDRYKRMYWILPLTGGVYVEGMESGVPEDYKKENEEQDEVKVAGMKMEGVEDDVGETEGKNKKDDKTKVVCRSENSSDISKEHNVSEGHVSGVKETEDRTISPKESGDVGEEDIEAKEDGDKEASNALEKAGSLGTDVPDLGKLPEMLENETIAGNDSRDIVLVFNKSKMCNAERESTCDISQNTRGDDDDEDGLMDCSGNAESVVGGGYGASEKCQGDSSDGCEAGAGLEKNHNAGRSESSFSHTTDTYCKHTSSDTPEDACISIDKRDADVSVTTDAFDKMKSDITSSEEVLFVSNKKVELKSGTNVNSVPGAESLIQVSSSQGYAALHAYCDNKNDSSKRSPSTDISDSLQKCDPLLKTNFSKSTLNLGQSVGLLDSLFCASKREPPGFSHTRNDCEYERSLSPKGSSSVAVVNGDVLGKKCPVNQAGVSKVIKSDKPVLIENNTELSNKIVLLDKSTEHTNKAVLPDESTEHSQKDVFLEKNTEHLNKLLLLERSMKNSGDRFIDESQADTDILRVPQINTGTRDTLVSVLNNSIYQAYQEHKPQEKPSDNISSVVKMPPSTVVTSAADRSSLLSSSLLFSAIAKLPQPSCARQLASPASALSLSVPGVGGASPLVTDVIPKSKHKHSAIDLSARLVGSTPSPAHSKNPQPLPPFHPSAQAIPLLDLTPPAAHTGHKSSKLSSIPHQSLGPSSLSHLPQSPYIPGLQHHPYGPCSASETLSSLASIISPPPAHSRPPLTATPISVALQTSPSSHSTSSISKTSSYFPNVDAILKGQSPFTSSELLQQAASQVLRSTESKKLTPPQNHTSMPSPLLSPSTPTKVSEMTTDDILSTYTPPQSSSDKGNKHGAEVVDHSLWFSILPRMPCDELSLSQPTQMPSSYYQQMSPTSTGSSYMTSSPSVNSLQSQDSLFTSLRLLTQSGTVASSPTSCSTPGLDFLGEFKVPQPPDTNLHSDPWELLRAAQGEAQPIPKNKQHGWWRIYDISMLKSIMSCTLGRGIREKTLQRSIHRYLDYAHLHCTFDSDKGETNPNTEPAQVEDKEQASKTFWKMKNETKKNKDKKLKKDEAEKDMKDNDKAEQGVESEEGVRADVEVKDFAAGVKTEAQVKLEKSDNDDEVGGKDEKCADSEEPDYVPPDDPDQWSVKTMQEIELAVLDEVEALEERIFQASLQAKQGWRPTKDNNLILVDRSVKELSNHEKYPLDVAKSRLLELEANIERRYLKPPLIRSVQLNLTSMSGHSDRSDGDFADDGNVPPGLLLWRQAVGSSESPAQLSLCAQLLAKSISWEKSIMRVTCQICRKDDNEAELLLCDGCDKGYHTYCFKPKMENIPEGDWYCFECVSKVSGMPHCVLCGTPGGRIVSCQLCPRYIHLDCADPPLPRMPKRWQCLNCIREKGNSKKSKKRKEKLPTVQRITITKLVIKEEPHDDIECSSDTTMAAVATSSSSLPGDGNSDEPENKVGGRSPNDKTSSTVDSVLSQPEFEKKKRKRKEKETVASPSPKKKEKMAKKERKIKEKKGEDPEKPKDFVVEEKRIDKGMNKDLSACGKLLTELEKREDGWPFLKPVNKKQFPSYKKYIKFPMDFSTARTKIRSKEYKHRQEFAADMRLIFNNCETFNEDDSEVGQAGYSMRQFFEARWLEVFPDDAS